ncbi:hypothetical protein FOCC_FOCC004871 [Frankliniella occidentalis]|uniref:RNA-binding protein 7 n=1 Tax=Frankliniella occidentalis TaxID=133901 RepID=A0A6J1T5P8_FRAOC|nr:RNA-binding protein 7 [Frankliniella occidentalis]KAE8748439.1 hypothetical protein FOCC_FOCC004871 [Frankliniella occidentalis]
MSYGMEENDAEQRKLYCGNLDEKVDEEILFELFLQAGPLERIHIPRSRDGAPNPGYAFIYFKHESSVPYAIDLFEDTALFGKIPKLRSRMVSNHHRSQSAPVNYGQNNMSHDMGHMDFDHLLQMSRNMLNPGPMGPPMGHPMGMPPMGPGAMAGAYAGSPILMGAPYMPPPPRMSFEPPPPGEEMPGSSSEMSNVDRNALSQSSLQGNWSARNSSNMVPTEDNGRGRRNRNSDHDHFRRDSHGGERGHRGNYYDQGGGRYDNYAYQGGNSYNQDHYSRNRNYDDYRGGRNERYDNRSRSHDRRDRRGRY